MAGSHEDLIVNRDFNNGGREFMIKQIYNSFFKKIG